MALQFIFAAGFFSAEFIKFVSLSFVLMCRTVMLQLVQTCYHRADRCHPPETEVVYL